MLKVRKGDYSGILVSSKEAPYEKLKKLGSIGLGTCCFYGQ